MPCLQPAAPLALLQCVRQSSLWSVSPKFFGSQQSNLAQEPADKDWADSPDPSHQSSPITNLQLATLSVQFCEASSALGIGKGDLNGQIGSEVSCEPAKRSGFLLRLCPDQLSSQRAHEQVRNFNPPGLQVQTINGGTHCRWWCPEPELVFTRTQPVHCPFGTLSTTCRLHPIPFQLVNDDNRPKKRDTDSWNDPFGRSRNAFVSRWQDDG